MIVVDTIVVYAATGRSNHDDVRPRRARTPLVDLNDPANQIE